MALHGLIAVDVVIVDAQTDRARVPGIRPGATLMMVLVLRHSHKGKHDKSWHSGRQPRRPCGRRWHPVNPCRKWGIRVWGGPHLLTYAPSSLTYLRRLDTARAFAHLAKSPGRGHEVRRGSSFCFVFLTDLAVARAASISSVVCRSCSNPLRRALSITSLSNFGRPFHVCR